LDVIYERDMNKLKWRKFTLTTFQMCKIKSDRNPHNRPFFVTHSKFFSIYLYCCRNLITSWKKSTIFIVFIFVCWVHFISILHTQILLTYYFSTSLSFISHITFYIVLRLFNSITARLSAWLSWDYCLLP